jgi:branched-chain amino acid transport system ATP-binding protein
VDHALEVIGLSASYGALEVVHDLNFAVRPGEIVGILGRNGAGKTTTMLAIAGYLPDVSGEARVDGARLSGPAFRRMRGMLGIVLEGRSIFSSLSVANNLLVAGADRERALTLFPELKPRLKITAGMLSGGEQQMLALARAIARDPKVLLIDELSFGLAPIACERLFRAVKEYSSSLGIAVLLVEQHLHYAASVCNRVMVMAEGCIRLETTAEGLVERQAEIERLYLAETALNSGESASDDPPAPQVSRSA